MSRRDALKVGVASAAAAVAATAVTTGVSSERADAAAGAALHHGYGPRSGTYSDEMFNVDAVLGGAWDHSPYGKGDQRGTFNELTPERTAAALKMFAPHKPINTYQLGEEMFNGFEAGGGIVSAPDPIGPNKVSVFEERFDQNFTFQIASQIDGLNHIGVGDVFYNGNRGSEIATPTGTSALGNETMGPVTARGVIYDVVGLKVAQGKTDTFFIADNGMPVLNDNYRITLDDLRACLERQRVTEIKAGEVPIMHTGWTHLVKSDPGRYLTQEPGIYLEEARYFADKKVALVASDTWGLEVLDPAVTNGWAFPAHQELIVHSGVRIGESFVTDAAIADNCYEGILIATPENVPGATCGSSAPAFMGQAGPKIQD